MDPVQSRGMVQVDPKLLVILKQVSQDTGVQLDQLINLSVYELARRLGYINPQPRTVQPPGALDLLDRAEPSPPPARRSARPAAPEKPAPRPAAAPRQPPPQPARKSGQDTLYMQVDKNAPVPIRKDVFLIGRGSKCDYIIEHRSVSREHAVITRERNGWFIEDLNSANGTWLDGEQISKHKIEEGDEIQISNLNLRFGVRPG